MHSLVESSWYARIGRQCLLPPRSVPRAPSIRRAALRRASWCNSISAPVFCCFVAEPLSHWHPCSARSSLFEPCFAPRPGFVFWRFEAAASISCVAEPLHVRAAGWWRPAFFPLSARYRQLRALLMCARSGYAVLITMAYSFGGLCCLRVFTAAALSAHCIFFPALPPPAACLCVVRRRSTYHWGAPRVMRDLLGVLLGCAPGALQSAVFSCGCATCSTASLSAPVE